MMMKHLRTTTARLLLLLLIGSGTEAGVLRIDSGDTKVSVQRSSPLLQLDVTEAASETTTLAGASDNRNVTNDVHIQGDVLASTTTTTTAPSVASDEQQAKSSATSRDEDASITIGHKATLDPAPGTFDDIEVILEPLAEQRNQTASPDAGAKSAQLLLLSVPKISEKPKEQEENIEEPEEELPEGGGSTTEVSETTTVLPPEIEQEEAAVTDASTAVDNSDDKLSSTSVVVKQADEGEKEQKEQMVEVPEQQKDSAATEGEAAAPLLETQPNTPNDRFGASYLLADVEPDFVVIDSDVPHLASFTHIGSDEQPIVQSVEFVPTSVNEKLIVNYVHEW